MTTLNKLFFLDLIIHIISSVPIVLTFCPPNYIFLICWLRGVEGKISFVDELLDIY